MVGFLLLIEIRKIKLKLNPNKMIETEIGVVPYRLITDGESFYSSDNNKYDEDKHNENGIYGGIFPSLYSGVNLQKIYSPNVHFEKVNNSVIFNKNWNFFRFQKELIVQIDGTPFLLADKKKNKIDKLLFYRPETKTTEIFDEKHLKIFGLSFIQYKNTLYFEGKPVKISKMDMQNLRKIENSEFITDGKSVFYMGNITGYGLQKINGVEYLVFDDRIIENVYTNQMTAINKDLLSDGTTLVSKKQSVKIQDLKLKIVIVK